MRHKIFRGQTKKPPMDSCLIDLLKKRHFKNLLYNLSRLFLFPYLQFSSRVQRPMVTLINISFGVTISLIDKMVQIKFSSEVACGLHLIAHRKILVAHWAFKAVKIYINFWHLRREELDVLSSDRRKCTNINRNTIVAARIRKSWALITVKFHGVFSFNPLTLTCNT